MSYFSKFDEAELRRFRRQVISDITASFTVEQQQKLFGIQAGATVGSDDIDRIMTANNGDVVTANNGNCMITNRVS